MGKNLILQVSGIGVLWGIFGREMSVDKTVYKQKISDFCSSLNVSVMIGSKRTKRVWYGACMKKTGNIHRDFIRKLRNTELGLLLV